MSPSAPPAGRASSTRVDPVAAAEAALRDDRPVDFALPFVEGSARRKHLLSAFVAACDAGNNASCWKAVVIGLSPERSALLERVAGNCRAGDLLSCRALPIDGDERFPDAHGAVGRSAECQVHDGACDQAALHLECAAGFPRSCAALAYIAGRQEAKTLYARAERLEDVGCRAGILSECSYFGVDVEKQTLYETQYCELAASCQAAGTRLRDAGNLLAARAMYERACQYDENDAHRCLGLAISYLDRTMPEPVAGRGQALLDWVCLKFEKTLDKGDSIVDMLPQCTRMTPHR